MSEGVPYSWREPVSHPSSFTPSFHSQLDPSTDLIVAIILIITGVVSVTGNGVVLLTHARKRKKLRAHELMTINLAVCDFGYSLLGAPCVVISSLSHGWILGNFGCLCYGFQGFVFGVGSLFTTCIISLDRCFKICCLRYGQWIERRHVCLSLALMWAFTLFWATLPVFGFGSYGPEPYGTSCTINWWRMKSSLNDRIYIYLILLMCFIIPTLIILTSYIAILIKVYRSGRTLASISSSSVTHGSSKDLRLTKIAAVVCVSFLIAWTPYAIVSFYSALTIKDEQVEPGGAGMMNEISGLGYTSGELSDYFSLHSFINWTTTENYGDIYDSWRNVTPDQYGYHGSRMSSTVASVANGAEHQGHQSVPSLRPEVTLIPAIFAKSHCMINPFIYQIMNRDFREDVYDMFCWRGTKRRRRRGRRGSDSDGFQSSFSLSYSHIWRRKSTLHSSGERGKDEENTEKVKAQTAPCQDNTSMGCPSIDAAPVDTQKNLQREQRNNRQKEKVKEKSDLPQEAC